MSLRRAAFTFKEIFSFPLVVFLLTACSPRRSAKPAAESTGGERGLASWYGKEFDGLPTASGETFRPEKISAAHRTLPLGTVVDVTNEKNGKTVRVRINDRGPFVAGRILDLSKAAAQEIASVGDGVVPVTLRGATRGDKFRLRGRPRRAAPRAPCDPGEPLRAGRVGRAGRRVRRRGECGPPARPPRRALPEPLHRGIPRAKAGEVRPLQHA